MKCPPALGSEEERLKALAEYGLGTDRGLPSLEPVVQLAARAFGMPVAAVNMIGSDHVFFAASHGIEPGGDVDMGREVSFCAHAITQDEVMVVPDATADERFHDNPLVTGPTGVRFYAGVPLRSPLGHALGALCVIDNRPRHDFSDADRAHLRELARMAADRLELRRVEISAEHSRSRFETYAQNSPTAVAWFDERGIIVAWNEAAAALYGHELSEGAGRSVETLVAMRDRNTVRDLIARAAAAGSVDGLSMPEGIFGLRKDGTEFQLGLSLFCWKDGGRLTFNAHLHDATERLHKRAELHRLAYTDLLTGLSNRMGFYRRMEQALLHQAEAMVLMIDLDGFKDVNDTLGHRTGDKILCEIARRMMDIAAPQDAVSRIGGDEFALLRPGPCDAAAAADLASNTVAYLSEPIAVDGHDVCVAASCGVAIAPVHAQEALELLGNADLALFHAKKSGRGQMSVFVPALRKAAIARRRYNMELHRAVSEGEFLLLYQPQVRLSDNQLVGAEALIRWRHPQRGLLSPAAFLPTLEGGPLAAIVGAWVLDEACAQAAYWRRHGAIDLRMGVNLFGAQFRVNNLAKEVNDVLERHGLPASALELEVTENIVLDRDDRMLGTLRRLSALGVGIAFDDYGTGYASLSLLRDYPLTRLKIDRSFVIHMHESDRDASVIHAIVNMARSFDLEVIAEGVENNQQRDLLRRMGCQEGQGYLFSKPLSAPEFGDMFGIGGAKALAVYA